MVSAVVVAFGSLALLLSAASSFEWKDWDGLQVCHPSRMVSPSSEAEVLQVLKEAASSRSQVKVVGAGHSFSAIALTDDTLLNNAILMSLDKMNRVLGVDKANGRVTVEAGIRIHDLNDQLHAQGLALFNTGAIAMQSVGGATSTSTHGTGRELGSMSTQIQSMRLALANGTILDIANATDGGGGGGGGGDSSGKNRLFNAARVGLGALGVVTQVELAVRPAFKLRRTAMPMDLDQLVMRLPQLNEQYERLQWYYTPYTSNATLLLREEVDADTPIVPCWPGSLESYMNLPAGAGNVTCTDWSYKALAHEADDATKYTEEEYFVKREHAVELMSRYRAFQEEVRIPAGEPCMRAPDCALFTGVRYAAKDDIWLSPMYRRDIAVVSQIVLGTADRTGPPDIFRTYGRGLERIALMLGGRPHWGKMNWATDLDFAQAYPKLQDFAVLRKELDPHDMFLNRYVRDALGLL